MENEEIKLLLAEQNRLLANQNKYMETILKTLTDLTNTITKYDQEYQNDMIASNGNGE